MGGQDLRPARCSACILPASFPGISFDEDGICSVCEAYVPPPPPLGDAALVEAVRAGAGAEYDCVVPLSGGKDSSYVLYYSVRRLGLRVLAVNFDSGFQSPQATANIANACEALQVPVKVVKAEPAYRLGLVRQAVRMAAITGTPVGVCGNCETGIRHYAALAAQQVGTRTILFGDSASEKLTVPLPTGLRRVFRRTRLASLPAMGCALGSYFLAASRERAAMGLPKAAAYRPSMAPVPFPEEAARVVHFFDYVAWETTDKRALLERELGWRATGDRMDRFDCFLHPLDNLAFLKETGISKDGYIYANLVRQGILTRERALADELSLEAALGPECREFVRSNGLDAYGTGWLGGAVGEPPA